jgi:amino acid transporter
MHAAAVPPAQPDRTLRLRDAVALVVGIVVGAGIFRAPAEVAAGAGSGGATLAAWALGGLLSLAGAACYAELASAFSHPGGEYHFLRRALGATPAFLFAWARLTVIPTGSVALLAFVVGDYATKLLPLGPPDGPSSAIYAALTVIALTALNASGVRHGAAAQNALTIAAVAGLLVLAAAALAGPAAGGAAALPPRAGGFGTAMVFVLLTYGGWNEAAYVSSELRAGRRGIAVALVASLGLVTALYLVVNVAYLRALGVAGVAGSPAVAAEVAARALGPVGAVLVTLLVLPAALTSANATLLMGSRACYAFGRDHPPFAILGRWSARAGTPVNAVLCQGAIALLLVGFGAWRRGGFEAMVSYTAPVFWLFFLLTGVSLFVLRVREPAAPRPFAVPLYPLTPAVFCLSCAYLLYSSLAYTGAGAALGAGVLAAGLVPLWMSRRSLARDPAAARPPALVEEEHA